MKANLEQVLKDRGISPNAYNYKLHHLSYEHLGQTEAIWDPVPLLINTCNGLTYIL